MNQPLSYRKDRNENEKNIRVYVKWLFIVAYLIFAFAIWSNRETIYQYIPRFFFETAWFKGFLDVAFVSLMMLVFACLLQVLRCSPIEQHRFRKVFKQIGLHNEMGEYPALLSIKIDRTQPHGYIYKLKNVSIPMNILDNEIVQNERSLHLKVKHIEYGKKARTILIYADKNAKPKEITITNEPYVEDLYQLPSMLCIGQTGAGKSYALSVLLAIYAKFLPDVSITIADYKHSLLTPLAHTQNYYGYDKAIDGITLFYQEFQERLAAHDSVRNKQIRILLIDEYSALIGSQDKKQAEKIKSMVGNLLLMSRSLNMRIIVAMQTAHSDFFKTGARDQFHGILALGNLSKEQKLMLFPENKEKMNEYNKIGEGYLSINGKGIERVKIAKIKDMESLIELIRPAMNR